MPDAIDFDHVAVAAERLADLWPRYVGDLGGQFRGGADSPGFRFAQVEFASGIRIEGLEPLHAGENDFLRRFLDASGPGPHHCTFKVPEFGAAIAMATEHGFPVVSVDASDPTWQEAFLHPKAACGIVIQLACSGADGEYEMDPPAASMPAPRVAPAAFDRVVHLVPDLDVARTLFVTVLRGAPVTDATTSFDARWPGGGLLHVTLPRNDDERVWLGTRPGRLGHLELTVADPAGISSARRRDDGRYEIVAADNLGTRLVLTSA